jgi:hypothetical protein
MAAVRQQSHGSLIATGNERGCQQKVQCSMECLCIFLYYERKFTDF